MAVLELAEDEAWLLSDATAEEAAAAGFGEPIDSRRYGPVPVELLVGRAWFRYGPLRASGGFPPRVAAATARPSRAASRPAAAPGRGLSSGLVRSRP